MKKSLPQVRIKAINHDLIRYVESSRQNYISGGGLYLVYKNNGVLSPFDESKQYKIYTRKGQYVLCIEATEEYALKRKK